jgi:hypothetical protein
VTEVRRIDGGACLIRVDDLDPVGLAQPYLDAAFTLASGAAHVLLALRANGGGDPATLAMIAGRLLGDGATQLSEVVYRDRRRQWWTPDRRAGTALTQPASVLVSERTHRYQLGRSRRGAGHRVPGRSGGRSRPWPVSRGVVQHRPGG